MLISLSRGRNAWLGNLQPTYGLAPFLQNFFIKNRLPIPEVLYNAGSYSIKADPKIKERLCEAMGFKETIRFKTNELQCNIEDDICGTEGIDFHVIEGYISSTTGRRAVTIVKLRDPMEATILATKYGHAIYTAIQKLAPEEISVAEF